MRISVDHKDPGYHNWCVLNKGKVTVKVLFNGEEVHYAITVDDVEGIITRYSTIPKDPKQIAAHLETLTGKVEIILEWLS